MKKFLHISAEFETVFTLNGSFCEQISALEVGEHERLYVTTLPLSASLLPYTIKLLGGVPQNNKNLAVCYALPRNLTKIVLKPRFNYVYTPQGVALRNPDGDIPKNVGVRLFWLVKKGDFGGARQLLSEDLSLALDDRNLEAFFGGFVDALSNDFYKDVPNSIILIDRQNKGHLLEICYKNGLIDNLLG